MSVAFIEERTIQNFPYITDHLHKPMLVDITPVLAENWLTRVPEEQRLVRDNAVDRFAKDMLAGQWRTDYEPYHFSKEGDLLNGQHRLWAVKETNVILENQLVVFGLDRSAYETLDQGTKRTFADTLRWYRYTNTLVLSAMAHKLYYWNSAQTFRKTTPPPTHYDLLRLVRANTDQMYESMKVGGQVATRVKPLTNSVVALAHLLCKGVDTTEDYSDTNFFFDRLQDGQGLVEGDAIYALRDKWARNAAKKREKPESYIQGAHILKAWNAFRDGRKVEVLAWKSGGAKPEPFPQPK